MQKGFFDESAAGVLEKDDPRIRKLPLDVGRPTFESAYAAYEIMMRGELYEASIEVQEDDEVETKTTPQLAKGDKETSVKVAKSGPEIEDIPLSQLHELASAGDLPGLVELFGRECEIDAAEINAMAGKDLMTPLHYAASASGDPITVAECVTVLLLQGHTDPTVRDGRNRTAYFLASHEKVRDAFRMARATLGEDYCEWDEGAKVGPPLTEDDLDRKKQKAAEKKRRQRARQKEKKAKDKAESEAAEQKLKQQEAEKKQEEDAKRIRDGLKPRAATATNVCDYCQKISKGKRRSQMLQRLDYVYCSTACVQDHKRELMAAAALKRFG